jgi:hypothetical protein
MTVVSAPLQAFTIQGREVPMPVAVRDATAAVAYYLVSAAAAQRLIAKSGLYIAPVVPGRTLCTIGVMNYKDNDLGQYLEIGVTFFVREGPGRIPFVRTLLGLVRGGLPAYIHTLPVNGDFTCEAGRTIWGFPKFVTDIRLSQVDGREVATLHADGQHILTQSMQSGGSRPMPERQQTTYAFRDGVLYKTPSTMRGEGLGMGFRGERLQLGSHPIADELRSLGLPKRPIFTTYISKMSGEFYAPETLPR